MDRATNPARLAQVSVAVRAAAVVPVVAAVVVAVAEKHTRVGQSYPSG
jgi:hypothetical protein